MFRTTSPRSVSFIPPCLVTVSCPSTARKGAFALLFGKLDSVEGAGLEEVGWVRVDEVLLVFRLDGVAGIISCGNGGK